MHDYVSVRTFSLLGIYVFWQMQEVGAVKSTWRSGKPNYSISICKLWTVRWSFWRIPVHE